VQRVIRFISTAAAATTTTTTGRAIKKTVLSMKNGVDAGLPLQQQEQQQLYAYT